MSNPDQIQRFLFEATDVRGVLVGLDESYRQVLERHAYPPAVKRLLGEMLAAVSLLSATLKFEGRLSLQARGEGALSFSFAECNHQRNLRAIARWDGEVCDGLRLDELLQKGQLAITIEPEHGQRYQGIVALDRGTLAHCLEAYFERSEQLATRILLEAGADRAGGMLLQALPNDGGEEALESWERVTHLGATLRAEELLELDNSEILHRLYHEEQVRLFESQGLAFHCDCSRTRSAQALAAVGREELETLLRQQANIHIDCQFCNERYLFDAADIAHLFSESSALPGSEQVH